MITYNVKYKATTWLVKEQSYYLVPDGFVNSISVKVLDYDEDFHTVVAFDMAQDGKVALFRTVQEWVDGRLCLEAGSETKVGTL